MEHCPGAGDGGGVLASDQQGDHDVRGFDVGDWTAVFVGARHEGPDHVFFFAVPGVVGGGLLLHVGAARADDGEVHGC